MAALKMANASLGEGSSAVGSCSVAVVTVSLLTWAPGAGGPMATNTQGQKAGPLGRPGLWAGNICSLCSLGLLRTMFLMRKGFLEARLSLLGFLPEAWCWVLRSHLWLRGLMLLWGR